MKTIRIKYLDWWNGFEPSQYLINEILQEHFNIVESETPDYVVSSVYDKKALTYDCIRIFVTAENFCPDFNLFDYGIGFEKLSFQDRYIWYPNWLMNPKYDFDVEKMLCKHINPTISRNKEFCSFVVSNGNADELRTVFFKRLSEYKRVNSGGQYLNNIGVPSGVNNKLEFQSKHKFSLCFENSSHPGYITEKLVQGFAAGTIPIYWGATDVSEVFNDKSMIIVKDNNDIERAIEQIKMIDSDDELYLRMLSEPAMKKPAILDDLRCSLESFIINIFKQAIETAKRRPEGQTVRGYYSMCMNNYNSIKHKRRMFASLKQRRT